MGVPGFWEHMSKYAHKVDIADLHGKTLTIDGHSWMLETPNIKGLKNAKNGFLITFYKRCICLRKNHIEPFVVFDKIPTILDQHVLSEPGVKILQKKRTRRGGRNGWNTTVYQDLTIRVNLVKDLLTAMGVRFVEGGADGDAQCAQLEEVNISDGCITSDMDYFLFGGKHMYRFDFNQSHLSAQHLSMAKLESMNLNRNRLIALAMLLGCDYVEGGLERVGIISALEILSEFTFHEDDHPISILDRFAGYVRGELPSRATDSDRKVKLKNANVQLPHGFPNTDMYIDASCLYLVPRIEQVEQETLPEKSDMDWKQVSTLLHNSTGYTPPRPSPLRKKQSQLPEYFANTRRRGPAVVEACSEEDRSKCSQREWAALEKLKATAAAYSLGTKRINDQEATSPCNTKTREHSPRKRRRKAVVEISSNSSSAQQLLVKNSMTQSETASIAYLD